MRSWKCLAHLSVDFAIVKSCIFVYLHMVFIWWIIREKVFVIICKSVAEDCLLILSFPDTWLRERYLLNKFAQQGDYDMMKEKEEDWVRYDVMRV